jgi:hypothetical protein
LFGNEVTFLVIGSISERVWFEQWRTGKTVGFQTSTHGLQYGRKVEASCVVLSSVTLLNCVKIFALGSISTRYWCQEWCNWWCACEVSSYINVYPIQENMPTMHLRGGLLVLVIVWVYWDSTIYATNIAIFLWYILFMIKILFFDENTIENNTLTCETSKHRFKGIRINFHQNHISVKLKSVSQTEQSTLLTLRLSCFMVKLVKRSWVVWSKVVTSGSLVATQLPMNLSFNKEMEVHCSCCDKYDNNLNQIFYSTLPVTDKIIICKLCLPWAIHFRHLERSCCNFLKKYTR